jgi:hypothetical protein
VSSAQIFGFIVNYRMAGVAPNVLKGAAEDE